MQTAVKIRRHLTPTPDTMGAVSSAKARRGGVRREVSERVLMNGESGSYEGWALNVSRGGVRVIVEEKVELGQEFEVTIGDPDSSPLQRRGRVVWIQEEQDGLIVGVEFVGISASLRAAPPAVSGEPPAGEGPAAERPAGERPAGERDGSESQ